MASPAVVDGCRYVQAWRQVRELDRERRRAALVVVPPSSAGVGALGVALIIAAVLGLMVWMRI